MELAHLISLISELPCGIEMKYVRGNDFCTFQKVDVNEPRVFAKTNIGEEKTWAPSFLLDLSKKIIENKPFNISAILNNKGSFRPIIDTIIAHTKEFYWVKKGSAIETVWIPSMPKESFELEEISLEQIPPYVETETTSVYNVMQGAELAKSVRESFLKYWSIIDQHGAQFELYVNKFESVINDEINKFKIGVSDVFEIVDFDQYKQLINQIISNNSDLSYLNDDTGPDGARYYIWSTNRHYRNYLNILAVSDFFNTIREEKTKVVSRFSKTVGFNKNLLTAMRTKPFLLLAGISGTGKSRIVKQMAFESCPDVEALRSDKTSPGNYQLIEVKPNWHDSTEVLGYESEIGGKHYVTTPFVKFLVKAMCYEDKAPFFVCMDEMNLAPVEQYFAEFLSVLESRKLVDGKITSEPLIKADIFKNHETQLRPDLLKKAGAKKIPYRDNETSDPDIEYGKFNEIYERLKVEGLRIPSNLIVVGTVNMDETTHQFSRKVIDRAMTIEMNIEDSEGPFVNFFKDCKDLDYTAEPQAKELFLPTVVQAKEAMESFSNDDKKHLTENVPTLLHSLNQTLNSTPFKIAYRVQNELVLYFHELRKEHPKATAEELLKQALDAILMLKVLPRIEGDEDLLEKPLKELLKYTEGYEQAHAKVEEMQDRLNGGNFTSFWP